MPEIQRDAITETHLAGKFKADVVSAALAVFAVRHQVPAELAVRQHHIAEVQGTCAELKSEL